MRQSVQIVPGVSFAMTLDTLEHLAPDCEVTPNREIELGKIKLGVFMHILKFEDFEGEHKITRSLIVDDADAKGGVDEAETPEPRLLGGHLVFESIEKLSR